MDIRPNWDEYFLDIVKIIATRSTCLRRKVGAVLVREKRILSTGYNGAVENSPHCSEVGCIREKKNISPGMNHELCRGLHAEQNALLFISSLNIKKDNTILYCTNKPCSLCAKMLIQFGVKKIVYIDNYTDELSDKIFFENNIEIIKIRKD